MSKLSQPAQEQANPRVYDGFVGLSRGVQSGKAKDQLTPQHAAWAVNTTFRNNHPRPRPGWYFKKDLGVTGRWQGAAVFKALDGTAHLVASIDGGIYKIEVEIPATPVTDISIPGDANSSLADRVWFGHPPGFLVIQNARARAIIYNGSSCRRSSIYKQEVPTGSVMAYGNGRLWVANPNRTTFIASDAIYNPRTGTPALQFRDSCLRFTENEYILDGGAFGVPVNSGRISAMQFMGNADTSTGQGPLQVFTESSIFTVDVPYDVELWAIMEDPVQTVALPTGGAMGPNAVTPVNSDLWYRDQRGVRSFQASRRSLGTWNNTPLSQAVDAVTRHDSPYHLDAASVAEFDNRLLCTTCPQLSADVGVYHLGLVVLDFNHVADEDINLNPPMPVWEGLWTGLKILQVISGTFSGKQRCFIFALGEQDAIELWELSKDAWFDSVDNPIEWKIYTPAYPFGDLSMLKLLKMGELWVSEIRGTPTVDLAYQPDDYPTYTDWYDWELCASATDCATDLCAGLFSLAQSRAGIAIPEPPTACRVGQRGRTMNRANTFGVRFIIDGALAISRFRLAGIPQSDGVVGECQYDVCETLPMDCDDYWWSYESEA